jgi:ankyrin repeat protein
VLPHLKHDFKKGWSAPHLLARNGTTEMAKLLLDNGAGFNAEN